MFSKCSNFLRLCFMTILSCVWRWLCEVMPISMWFHSFQSFYECLYASVIVSAMWNNDHVKNQSIQADQKSRHAPLYMTRAVQVCLMAGWNLLECCICQRWCWHARPMVVVPLVVWYFFDSEFVRLRISIYVRYQSRRNIHPPCTIGSLVFGSRSTSSCAKRCLSCLADYAMSCNYFLCSW